MTDIDTSTNIGWTAQSSVGFIHEVPDPGQTFKSHELPDPEVQRQAGINPVQYRAQHGLHVEDSDLDQARFVGSETGLSPEESAKNVGNNESFVSEPADVYQDHVENHSVGASFNGLEYPRSESGHILYNPHAGDVYPDPVETEEDAEEVPSDNNEDHGNAE